MRTNLKQQRLSLDLETRFENYKARSGGPVPIPPGVIEPDHLQGRTVEVGRVAEMMPRIRSIKPEFWESESIMQLSPMARLLFIATWNIADDDGRLRWHAAKLRGFVFPYDDVGAGDVDVMMREIEGAELVEVYQASRTGDGTLSVYASIITWAFHQRIDKPKASLLPTPPSGRVYVSGMTQKPVEPRILWPRANSKALILDASKTDLRRISDASWGEREREQGEEQGEEQDSLVVLKNDERASEPQDVFDYWNSNPDTKSAKALTTTRIKKLHTRLRSADWPWREAIDKLPVPNDAKFTWQPNFDWLIKNDENALKIVEGAYDRKTCGVGAGQTYDPAKADDFGEGF